MLEQDAIDAIMKLVKEYGEQMRQVELNWGLS